MPAVVSDSSVLIGLAAIRQFHLLPVLKPLLAELIERHHFRLHSDIYRQALTEAGEQP